MLNPNALRITQLLGFYCAAAHWLACGFFWLGRWQLQNTSLGGSNEFTGDPWLVVWCLQAASGGFSGLGEGLCTSIVPLLYLGERIRRQFCTARVKTLVKATKQVEGVCSLRAVVFYRW